MRNSQVLYQATQEQFFSDVQAGRILEKMEFEAQNQQLAPSESEKKSWRNNAPAIKELLEKSKVRGAYVVFEYLLPRSTKRVDCMLFGEDAKGAKNVLHIELKQWSNETVHDTQTAANFEIKEDELQALTGGELRVVAHPSQQARGYNGYLSDFLEVIQSGEVKIRGCSYCYNYLRHLPGGESTLYASQFRKLQEECRTYAKDETSLLAEEISWLFDGGNGQTVFETVMNSDIRQSKKLLDSVGNMFTEGMPKEFHLLEDQIPARNEILDKARKLVNQTKKQIIIVHGGPGTGKTVIALKVLSQMARAGAVRNIFYTTRSTALKDNLKRKLKKIKVGTTTAEDMILPIFGIKPKYYKENEIELLLVDEAHRLMDTANHYSMPADSFTYLSQVMSLIYCSKVSVFFIDDHQAIDGQEIGYSEDIIQAAKSYRTELGNISDQMAAVTRKKKKLAKYNTDIELWEAEMAAGDFSNCDKYAKKKDAYEKLQKEIRFQTPVPLTTSLKDDIKIVTLELTSQFRCNGSDNYLDWLDQLMYEGVDKITSKFSDTEYEFKIFDDPHKLYDAVVSKNHPEMTPKEVSRLSAGYWWQWSDKAAPNGDLVKDVKIPVDNPTFEMPWETKATVSPAYRDKYAPDTNSWIDDPRGINQIGCVFTAQGFEVDYMGVILSPDIRYNAGTGMLDGVIGATRGMKKQDKNQTDCSRHIRNIYRVLLSRGRKGTFIYCCDPKVREFFENCDKKRK